MTEKLDQGPIVAQCRFTVYPYIDEVQDVYNRALGYAYLLFSHTVPDLERIRFTDQNDAEATYYSSKDYHRLGDRLTFTKESS